MPRLALLAVASLFLLACPEDPASGVLLGAIECTPAGDRVEVRGTASGREGERLVLEKSGDGAPKLRVDAVDCDDWRYDNDVPGQVDCMREGNAASTAVWSVTYAVTTGMSLASEVVLWTASIKDDGAVKDEVIEGRVVTLSSSGGCLVAAP